MCVCSRRQYFQSSSRDYRRLCKEQRLRAEASLLTSHSLVLLGSGSQHSLNCSLGPLGRGRFRAAGCGSAQLGAFTLPKQTARVTGAARGLDFCFVILTRALRPPPKSRAWLPRATRNPQLFILSLLPPGLAFTREVRDADAAGREKLVFSFVLVHVSSVSAWSWPRGGSPGCPGRLLPGLGTSLPGGALETPGREVI